MAAYRSAFPRFGATERRAAAPIGPEHSLADLIHHAHDALFRAAFGDPARAGELLRNALPEDLVAAVDWASLGHIDASFVDRELRQHHADLLFTARIAGRDTLLYLLLEHKAEPDRWTPLQLLRYAVRAWRRFQREQPQATHLPPVVAFVLHHGARPWRGPRDLRALIDLEGTPPALTELQPQLEFVLDDLAATAADALQHRRLAAATLLPLLHLQQLRRPARTASLLLRWRELHLQLMAMPGGQALIDQLVSYVAAVSEDDPADLRTAYRSIHMATEETYMTVAQKLITQGLVRGRQEGRQKGRQEGRQEGRAELLLALLKQRFGALPQWAFERIGRGSPGDLDRWASRLLTAPTCDDVFAP
jgi:predicted transposase/invertase (TIGR01784 family)